MTTEAARDPTTIADLDEMLIARLSAAIDKANLRLDLTREALKAAMQSDTQYQMVINAIEAAVNEGAPGRCAREEG